MLAQWISWAYRTGFAEARREPLITLGSAPLDVPEFRSVVLGQLGESRLVAAIDSSHKDQLNREDRPFCLIRRKANTRTPSVHSPAATLVYTHQFRVASRSVQTATLQQGFDLGIGAPEPAVKRHRIFTSSPGEDVFPEGTCSGLIEQALLPKCLEGVGIKHFGPDIAVVAGRVTAGEDVAEVRAAVAYDGSCRSAHRGSPHRFRSGGHTSSTLPDEWPSSP